MEKLAMRVALMALAGAASPQAGGHFESAESAVRIRLHDSDRVGGMWLTAAELVAGKILASAGLPVRWEDGRGQNGRGASASIDVSFSYSTPHAKVPGALAESFPFARDGNRVTVFFDRVQDSAARDPRFAARILGHVLAHEIGHVLLATNSHSSTGVMKAHWEDTEYRIIRGRQLSFLPEEAAAMRARLAN